MRRFSRSPTRWPRWIASRRSRWCDTTRAARCWWIGSRRTATPSPHTRLDTTFDHLPTRERIAVATGSTFVDFADHSDEFAPLFALKRYSDVGWLALRGLRFEGQLSGDHRAVRDAEVLRHADVGAARARRRAVRARVSPLPGARSARGGGAHAGGRDAARARRVRAEAGDARAAAAQGERAAASRRRIPSGSSRWSARRRTRWRTRGSRTAAPPRWRRR